MQSGYFASSKVELREGHDDIRIQENVSFKVDPDAVAHGGLPYRLHTSSRETGTGASTTIPNQSGDEPEWTDPRHYRLGGISGSAHRLYTGLVDQERSKADAGRARCRRQRLSGARWKGNAVQARLQPGEVAGERRETGPGQGGRNPRACAGG